MTITRNESDIDYIWASGLGVQAAALDNLRVTGDLTDDYSFQVASGDVLEIRTTTPGGDVGEPVNDFDPVIELSNELGFFIASDDNSGADGRNAPNYVCGTWR